MDRQFLKGIRRRRPVLTNICAAAVIETRRTRTDSKNVDVVRAINEMMAVRTSGNQLTA